MVKIYHNPRCSKSRQALEILQKNLGENKVEIVKYLEKGLEQNEISELLRMLNLKAIDAIRKNEKEFKEQNLGAENLLEADLIEALIKTPKLLQRPIVVSGEKAIIARPPEDALKIL